MNLLIKRRLWVVGVTTVIVVGGGLAYGLSNKSAHADAKAQKEAQGTLEFAAADLTTAQPRVLAQAIPITGTLRAVNHAVLRSKIAAIVESVKVREGESVHEGQVLATFDQSNIAAQLHQQQGNLDVARAQLALDEKTHIKNQALLKQGFISENAFDTSLNAAEISRAKVKAAQALVEIAANAMNDTVLHAPIAGVVGKRYIQPGEKVDLNSELLSIVDLSEMEIQVAVPTTDIPGVQVGQVATFKVDGFYDETFSGYVKRIDPETEENSRTILVYLSVKNPKGSLKGGMFAKGQLALGQSAPKLTIPASAIMDGSGQPYVYWIDQGKVARANITVGMTDEHSGMVEVKSGLKSGDMVVATKMNSVKPGTLAIIKTPPAGTAKQG